MKSIVIIGGGFSGTAAAVNLARLSPAPLQIFLVNKSADPCRGIAYGTRNGCHLLNVVARNMSALADQPNHFVEWLRTRAEYLDEPATALREKFAPRRVYGDYLHNLFHWHAGILADQKKGSLEYIQDEAQDISIADGRAHVTLAGGRVLAADKVVLAAGNQAPAQFRVRGLDAQNAKYIGNPWAGWEKRLPERDQDVFLLGTGLTMVDVFLVLQDLGWQGRIIAVSRNGLLPLSHFKGFEYPDFPDDENAVVTLRKLFSLFKRHYRAAVARDLNPAILVDRLRPFTQRIWQQFSVFEKRQFARHLRTRWNVMRHRIAPEIYRQLQAAMAQGRLQVIKGRLRECVETGDGLTLSIETPGGKQEVQVGAVINCTGPRESYVSPEPGLFSRLFARGMIQPDELDMGLKVNPDFSVVDSEGRDSAIIFALGSLLKGTLWETTAVPELRSQAFRLAETIAGQITERGGERSPIQEIVEDAMEYSI